MTEKPLAVCLAALFLTGCAIAPTRVNLEVQHTSHLMQHFGGAQDQPQHGYDSAGIDLHWQLPARISADIVEGAVIGACSYAPPVDHCEGLAGRREVFSARVDYTLWQK